MASMEIKADGVEKPEQQPERLGPITTGFIKFLRERYVGKTADLYGQKITCTDVIAPPEVQADDWKAWQLLTETHQRVALIRFDTQADVEALFDHFKEIRR